MENRKVGPAIVFGSSIQPGHPARAVQEKATVASPVKGMGLIRTQKMPVAYQAKTGRKESHRYVITAKH